MGGFTPYEKCKLLCIRLLRFHPHLDTLYRPEKIVTILVYDDSADYVLGQNAGAV